MPALVIGETQRARIAELKALAAAHPYDARSAKAAADEDIAGYRDMMSTMTVELPVGFVVTYTHEQQQRAGLCHHISISVTRPKKVPHPEAVEMILQEFGMRPLRSTPQEVWIEDISPTLKAINVVQPIAEVADA